MKISKTLFFAAAASLLAGTFFAPEAEASVTISKTGTGAISSSRPSDTVRMSDFVSLYGARDVTIMAVDNGTIFGGTVIIDSLAIVGNNAATASHLGYHTAASRNYYQFLTDGLWTRWDNTIRAGRSGFVIFIDGTPIVAGAGVTSFNTGNLVVEDGAALEVRGLINAWVDYGSANGTNYGGDILTAHMDGAQTIKLEGNARLDISLYSGTTQYASCIQSLHNLYSTTTGGQLATCESSSASSTFVNIYIDAYDGTTDTLEHGGSIGNITGSANIIKGGAGNFTLLGNNTSYAGTSTSTGNVYITNGAIVLTSAAYVGGASTTANDYDPSNILKKYCESKGWDYEFGISLLGASSVNIAGTAGSTSSKANEGSLLATYYGTKHLTGTYTQSSDGTSHTYESDQGSLIEAPTASSLIVKTNQVIHNLQAMFANGYAATDTKKSISSAIAAAAAGTVIPVVTGTGSGSVIGVDADTVLAIYQESGKGGIYKGSIAGISTDLDGNDVADLTVQGGYIVKYGAGSLALMLQTANYKDIAVAEGQLIVNISTLNGALSDYGPEIYGTGQLTIVENQAATLNKILRSEKNTDFEFANFAYIDTIGGKIDVSSGNRATGTIEIGVQQSEVYGNVIVRGGVELKLTSEDSFVNAECIALLGDIENRTDIDTTTNEVSAEAVLSFGGKNQVVNNLIGDKWSRVETGTSSRIELNIAAPTYNEAGTILSGAFDSENLDLSALNSGLYGTFYGKFTGWGNIIKTGAGTLSLSGASTNFGAVIVAEGDLTGTASNFDKASALILDTGTSATFVGNQFFSAIYGAEGSLLNLSQTATADDGTEGATTYYRLTLGESVSRQSELHDVSTLPVTVFLSNSDRELFANVNDISTAMKPLLDLLDETDSRYEALQNFASGDAITADQLELVKTLFGNDSLAQLNDLTEKDITTAYLKLLRENNIISGIDDLTYEGDLIAGSIYKQNSNTQSLLGQVATATITVAAGTLEVAGDSLTAIDDNASVSVTVNDGAEFVIRVTDGVSEDTVEIDGKGALVIETAVDLNLNEQFINETTGTITIIGIDDENTANVTMTLRKTTTTLATQGNITVEGNANLVLFQNEDDLTDDDAWSNSLNVSGDLIKTGNSSLTLVSNDSHVDGNVVVQAGSLSLIDFDDAGTTAIGGINIAAGTSLTLAMSEGIDSTFTGTIVSAGTLVKTGDGALTISANSDSDFAGTFKVLGGSVTIATANAFASSLVLEVAENTFTTLQGDQTIAELSGAGLVDITDSTLTLALNNEDSSITVDNATKQNGTYYYVATVPATEELVGNFSGQLTGTTGSALVIDGVGAYAFDAAASIAADIAITVKNGQLVVSAGQGDREIVVNTADGSAAELVYNVEEGQTGLVDNDLSKSYIIGKIGTGTLELGANQVSNKILTVYEGTLAIDSSTNSFVFENATVAKDATLLVNFSGTNGDAVKLTLVEGSGTLKFVNAGTPLPITLDSSSVLPTSLETAGTDGRYFNGLISFENMAITVNTDTTLPAVSLDSKSSLKVANGATLTFDLAMDSEIACATTAEIGSEISISSQKDSDGDFYKLAFTDSVTGTIAVNNGAVQIDCDETLTSGQNVGQIVATGSADLYFYVDADNDGVSQMTKATIDASGITGTLRLIKTGEGDMSLDLSQDEASVIGEFVTNSTSMRSFAATTTTKTSTQAYTIGVDQGTLTLQNIDQMGSHVSLTTLGAGTLVLQGTQTLDRNISGDGNVEKISGTLTISSDQSFTGTFVLAKNSRTTTVLDNASMATSQLVIEKGATLIGGVTLTNTTTNSALALKSGGTIRLSADDMISYAGTLKASDIAGTIALTGTLTQGQEKVIFKSTGTQDAFSRSEQVAIANAISYSSSSFILSQNSAETISVYSLNSDLSSLSLHEGLDGFANALSYVLEDAMPSGTKNYVLEVDLAQSNPIAVTLFKSSASELSSIVKQASPLMYSAMTTMLWASHDNDISQFRDRGMARRFEMVDEFANHGWQAWADVHGAFVENGNGSDAPVYDYNMIGLLAGADRKVDDYTVLGVALGYDFGKADVHGNGGRIESNDLRFTVYGSTLLGDGSWFVDYGATASVSDFDIKHRSVFGTATDDANGVSIGAYGVLGRGFLLMVDQDQRVVLTPYVGLSAYYSMIDSISESGGNANLDIDKIKALSLRGMLGASLDWALTLGEYEARVSVDAAYSHEFGDDEIDIDASVGGYSFSCDAAGTSKDTFSIGPAITLGIGPKTSIRAAYRANFGTNEEISHNVNLGVRHSF